MRATKRRKTATPTGAAPAQARVEAPSVATRIAVKIEDDVVLGRRHPRERLVEQDLCRDFRTHRADVRLALFELEKRGIVERIPNRGAIVRDLTPAEVIDVYAVREELEVMAVRVLPMPAAAADLAGLEAIQREHSRAVKTADLLAVHHSNVRFHRALYGLCGNACLIETIEQLAQKVSVIRSSAHADAKVLERTRQDHIEMIEALKHSRRDDLIALTRRHLKPAARAYIKAYELRFGAADT
jgi:DNA-binding GntR family transcriptional regulator